MFNRRVLGAVFVVFICLQAAPSNGDTGSSILNVPVSARAASLGDGAVALAEGADMATVNPAGLASGEVHEVSLTYAALPDGVNFGSLFYSIPLPGLGVGLGVRSLTGTGIDGRDASGNATGSLNTEDGVAELSLAHGFFADSDDPDGIFRLGGAARYVSSRLSGYSAHTEAYDAGAEASMHIGTRRLQMGAALTNAGQGLKFLDSTAALPTAVTMGAAFQPVDQLWLLGGASMSSPENSKEASFGLEYVPNRMMALRMNVGYRMVNAGITNDQLTYGAGMRVSYSNLILDFAFLPMSAAGYQERVSLSMRFGVPWSDRVDVDNAEDPGKPTPSHSGMLGTAWSVN